MSEQTKNTRLIRSHIISRSHEISEATLDKWNEQFGSKLDYPVKYEVTSSRSFNLYLYVSKDDVARQAYYLSHSILVMLNVVNHGGHFWFNSSIQALPYVIVDKHKELAIIPNDPLSRFYKDKQILDYDKIKRGMAIWIMGIDLDEKFFQHYIAGMQMLNNPGYGYDFREEIFLSFFKVIERFSTTRFYGDAGRHKEGDIKEVYKNIYLQKGVELDSKLIDEVSAIYELRGRVAAHSTGSEIPLNMEDALKCKTLADLLLDHYLYQELYEKAKGEDGLKDD